MAKNIGESKIRLSYMVRDNENYSKKALQTNC